MERAELEKRFKAEPIPASTMIPRYQQIMQSQQRRREEVKRRSIELTQQNERPFSFYYRDKDKFLERLNRKEPEPEKPRPFKATPIPITMSISPFDPVIQEQERKVR